MVGGRLDQHPVAGGEKGAGEQRKSLLGAVGDQDLIRVRVDSPLRVAVSYRTSQNGMTGRVVADVAGDSRQCWEDTCVGICQLRWRSIRGGAGEQDHAVLWFQQMQEDRRARSLPQRACGTGHAGAAALAPDDPFVLAQQLIGGHDGAAPYRESGREGTVGWQRFPRGQLAFIDQLPQPGREKHVQWPAAR
jgi:hypothetical protein